MASGSVFEIPPGSPSMFRQTLIKTPNADCWVDPVGVIAVRKLGDVIQRFDTERVKRNKEIMKSPKPNRNEYEGLVEGVDYIKMAAFELRMIDGKSITVTSPDRTAIAKFLYKIGVEWDGENDGA